MAVFPTPVVLDKSELTPTAELLVIAPPPYPINLSPFIFPATSNFCAVGVTQIPTFPPVSILILSSPLAVCKNLIGHVDADIAIPVALPDERIIPSPAIPYCVPKLIVVLLTPNVKNRVPPLSFATKELMPLAFVFCACTSRSPDVLPTTSSGALGVTPIPTFPVESILAFSVPAV